MRRRQRATTRQPPLHHCSGTAHEIGLRQSGRSGNLGPSYAELVKIYTKRGDDGTTVLFFGGRVSKDSPRPVAYGTVDEAQAAIGVARAATNDEGLDALLISIGRDLYVAMAELATAEENHAKLVDGETRVTAVMVERLEKEIDHATGQFEMPTEFVVPGGSVVSAALDVARTVVRRAERKSITAIGSDGEIIVYLNRLSDLLWALARWQENSTTPARQPGKPAQ